MDPTTARLRYHGTGGSLFGLMFVNALLTVITLTIYSAWAKTKVRVFHWSHTELDGDRFAYHGTGGELFMRACFLRDPAQVKEAAARLQRYILGR